jgi:hypothetical protein
MTNSHIQPIEATVSDVILLERALMTLLAEETSALEASRKEFLPALQERKEKLLRLLNGYQAYLSRHPERIHLMTPPEKQELTTLTPQLEATLERNRLALASACEVNRIVVTCVKRAFMQATTPLAYTRRGGFAAYGRQSVALSYNQMV